jgi:DNA-binding FadR family transcriptional regulator
VGQFHDNAVETIAGWIVSARFAAGATLPVEHAIGEELGASRTTVREALKTLAAKGLVRVGPRTGSRVQPPDAWNLFDSQVVAWRLAAPLTPDLINDLVEMRLLLEPEAAALAAQRAGAIDIAAIRHAYELMEQATEGKGSYIQADLDFHQAILRAAHNQFLTQLSSVVGAVLRLSFELSVTSPESARASLPAHAGLLRAIGMADPGAARDCLVGIIRRSRDDMARIRSDLAAAPRRSSTEGALR